MKVCFRRFPSGIVILGLYFLCLGCSTETNPLESPEPLYKQALSFGSRGD